MRRRLLILAVGYRLQERVLGGLKPATRRRLAGVTEDLAAGREIAEPVRGLKPGTRLLREWRARPTR